jgi:riboflavin kinase
VAERTEIAIHFSASAQDLVMRIQPLKIELAGRVFTGQGEGRKYVELSWVKQQIKEKLGLNPYPGTLNLRLDEENVKHRVLLEKDAKLRLCCSEGYCTGLLFKASVDSVECGVVIPQVENYPENVLEVMGPVNLKQKLRLRDGDLVTVTVFV